MFAIVPLDETIKICLGKLYASADPPHLPRSVLKNLLVFATLRSHFVFHGQFYDQVDGVAMGSLWVQFLQTFLRAILKKSGYCADARGIVLAKQKTITRTNHSMRFGV